MSTWSGILQERQLHFVTGKGGVGKSLVSCALARHFTGLQLRTLLVQLNCRDVHSSMLGCPQVTSQVQRVDDLLWAVDIDPEVARREYGLLILKSESLTKTVFDNRLSRYFLRFVPSLAELNMLGKIWFHAAEEIGGRRRFDRVVVDLPATGHAITQLTVARAIHSASPPGRMASDTLKMRQLLEDETRAATHIVSLPEETPVNESLYLADELERRSISPLGGVIVNRMVPPRVRPPHLAVAKHLSASLPPTSPLQEAPQLVTRRAAREQRQSQCVDRLRQGLNTMPLIQLPRLATPEIRPAQLQTIVSHFGATLTDDGNSP